MGQRIDDQVSNLERVVLEFEGAQFATRHLLAALLSRLDSHEAEECLRELQRTGREHGIELGETRLTGYLDELAAVKVAIQSGTNRPVPPLRVVS
jgi:hypothetical protein